MIQFRVQLPGGKQFSSFQKNRMSRARYVDPFKWISHRCLWCASCNIINEFAKIFDSYTVCTTAHPSLYSSAEVKPKFHLFSLLPQLEPVRDVRVYEDAYKNRIMSIKSRDTLYNRRRCRPTQSLKINVNSLHERRPMNEKRDDEKKSHLALRQWNGCKYASIAVAFWVKKKNEFSIWKKSISVCIDLLLVLHAVGNLIRCRMSENSKFIQKHANLVEFWGWGVISTESN